MAHDPNAALVLIDTASQQQLSSPIAVSGHDVTFPEGVRGWSDVLDCRPEPYKNQSIEENCHFAEHVHKKFILVTKAHLSRQSPGVEKA